MRTKKSLFVENPLVGNMAYHSPAHLCQFVVLMSIIRRSGYEISTIDLLDVLLRDSGRLWGAYMDQFNGTNASPHYMGALLMCAPNDSRINNLQNGFVNPIAWGYKRVAAQLACDRGYIPPVYACLGSDPIPISDKNIGWKFRKRMLKKWKIPKEFLRLEESPIEIDAQNRTNDTNSKHINLPPLRSGKSTTFNGGRSTTKVSPIKLCHGREWWTVQESNL